MKDYSTILEKAIGKPVEVLESRPIGGGCINNAQRIQTDRGTFFVKLNTLKFRDVFENEGVALEEIAATRTLRVPRPIVSDTVGNQACLVLEFVEEGAPTNEGWEKMGQQLAALHALEQPYFGWTRDNVIGATPQPNPRSEEWAPFFRDHRLEHQFKLCRSKGFAFQGSEQLLQHVPRLLDHKPKPSLLHGDLWSGNASFDSEGAPFVYDPCSYYGDRETDIAFTEFFGGFDRRFYAAYNEALPLDEGYRRRKQLYNLYHCLNHTYLFGGSYAGQAQSMIEDLVSL